MSAAMLTMPATLSPEAPPHRISGHSHDDILRAWTFAATVAAVWGVALFGLAALMVIASAVGAAILTDLAIGVARGRPVVGGLTHAGLIGLLLALTLPATAAWYIAAMGSMIAIVVGKVVFGGLGHYLWHPALVGRVAVQMLFVNSLAVTGQNAAAPVLARSHIFTGDLGAARRIEMSEYQGWTLEPKIAPGHALLLEPPVSALRRFADGKINPDDEMIFEPLLRDALPPWHDTVLGTVPGAIGETCTLALIVAGLYLIYRGYLRWQVPVAVLTAAGIAAAILPVKIGAEGEGYFWLPIFAVEQSRAVGLAYVLYHLTAGQLMLGAFLLAGDMTSTPMRALGQLVFGAGVGVITIFMRLYGVVEGECYWAILIMNTFVTFIDRRMKRPVLGIPE